MSKDMADKAVETDTQESSAQHNNSDVQDGTYWKIVQLESLLAALVNSKVVAIKANRGSKAFLRKPSDGVAPSSPTPDDLRYHKHHSHHHHHQHHHGHHKRGHHHKRSHHQAHAKKKAAAAVCKVKQWHDGSATMLQLTENSVAETDFCHGDAEGVGEEGCDGEEGGAGCRCHYKVRQEDDHYVTVDMELDDLDEALPPPGQRPRRKRRKRQLTDQQKRKRQQRLMYAHAQEAAAATKVKVVDPDDLPKRAKWTIIITAGFLLFTCMLLVGITLRMAPIIDQMVRNQNEELMNSLNRQDLNDSLLMA
ncbi:hypothetical protein LSTR_LSTR008953 [Laodelphax striatellus]|uniref:Lateral signaling target protein 2 homolog n=1 Tax=Laodelphax striatellus TaxID=195883 RepID=A0A482WKI5_LAOST|nr:hypothetical protein LSTR_LSTR008953 [Laodelphax striatellus]